jgi:hypothetical protein
MHDPLVVAFEIKRPWPTKRDSHGWRYWPALVTVWHREPNGHDSGEVCKHYRHDKVTGKTTILHAWRWHAHHWKIQIHALQELRRRLLTRCAWCGGRSTKRDAVDHSLSWDGPRGRWWRGEPGLFHGDCASIHVAHGSCTCDDPLTDRDGWGTCSLCGKGRSWGVSEHTLSIHRGLAIIPAGTRDRAVYDRVISEAKTSPEEATP